MISSYKVVLSAALHKSNDGLTRLRGGEERRRWYNIAL